MLRRLLPLLIAASACASMEKRPEWVLKGYDPHADPTGARLSAVGTITVDAPNVPPDAPSRHAAADADARRILLDRLRESVPADCRQRISSAIMTKPITERWTANDGTEYALVEISQGTLWELCPAMMEGDLSR